MRIYWSSCWWLLVHTHTYIDLISYHKRYNINLAGSSFCDAFDAQPRVIGGINAVSGQFPEAVRDCRINQTEQTNRNDDNHMCTIGVHRDTAAAVLRGHRVERQSHSHLQPVRSERPERDQSVFRAHHCWRSEHFHAHLPAVHRHGDAHLCASAVQSGDVGQRSGRRAGECVGI